MSVKKEMGARKRIKLLEERDVEAETIRDIKKDNMTYLVVLQSDMDTSLVHLHESFLVALVSFV